MTVRRHRMVGIRYVALSCLLVVATLITAMQFKNESDTGTASKVYEQKRRLEQSTSDHCKDNKTKTGSGMVEDLLSLNIPEFEENFKNPCFYDTCNSLGTNRLHQLRCLPYFHVLGIDKSGSTDLFFRIIEHPQIKGNDGIMNKETMWWSWKRYGQWLKKSYEKNETLDDYLQYFDNSSSDISKYVVAKDGFNGGDYHPIITGDGTPMDFWDFSGWPMIPQNANLTEPYVLTPHLMKYINPKVKLIIILRNPVDRLYSDYLFLGLGMPTAKAFSKAVNSSLTFFDKCSKRKGEKLCLFDRDLHLAVNARIHVSVYSVYLREWLKWFPREQILILRNEDYAKDIKSHMKNVFKFLDVVDLPEDKLDKIAAKKRAYKTSRRRKSGPMFKETREQLEKFFETYNLDLAGMLNDIRFTWLDQPRIPGKDYKDLKHRSRYQKF